MKKIATLLAIIILLTSVGPQEKIYATSLVIDISKDSFSIDGNSEEEVSVPVEETTTEISTKESETSTEELTTEVQTGEEITTEEPTTEEATTKPDYIIINDVYKVKDGTLIEYLGNKKDKTVTELVIPKTITKIGDSVFYGFKYINKVSFASKSKIKEIGSYSFQKCSALKTITLPEGIKKIGYKAFDKCTSLKKITIPSTVTEGNTILGKSTSVTKVTFASGFKTIPNDILKYAYSVETISMKSGVTTIGNRAFYHCTGIKKLKLSSTVKTLKSSAFNGCSNLSDIKLPNNISYIGTYAFKKCLSLQTLELPKAITSFGSKAFDGDKKLTLLVYANTPGKAYARVNGLKWKFTESELKRQEKAKKIYKKYMQVSGTKSNQFKLKKLKDYVPQGTCIIGNYLVVSMYYRGLKKNSILLLYNKTTGKYLKRIVLPSRDHVGSIANVEGRLVVGLCNISTTDYVAVIKKSKLKKIKNGKTIKYDYVKKIPGYADFSTYDGSVFWAGRSDNVSGARMYGYKVKIKKKKLVFTKKYSFAVPANTQGIVVKKGKGNKRTFVLTTSYGRISNSTLLTYKINIKKNYSLGHAVSRKTIPPMAEGMCMTSDSKIFMVFESAAGEYCSNPDNTSEIKIKNICRLPFGSISNLMN